MQNTRANRRLTGLCTALLLAALLLAACSGTPASATASAPADTATAQAATAAPAETATPQPTETATPAPEATTQPATASPQASVPPSSLGSGNSALVAVGGYVVGGFVGGQWTEAGKFYGQLKEETCSVYGPQGFVDRRTGTPYDAKTPEADQFFYKLFSEDEASGSTPMVGVIGGEWLPQKPYDYSENPTDAALFDALSAHMKKSGVTAAQGDMRSLFMADVDGDGAPEQVLSAGNITSFQGEQGKPYYSCVLLIDGSDVTELSQTLVKKYDDTQYIESCVCASLLDLNKDGKAEIILEGNGRENNWVNVMSLVNGKWTGVISNATGA